MELSRDLYLFLRDGGSITIDHPPLHDNTYRIAARHGDHRRVMHCRDLLEELRSGAVERCIWELKRDMDSGREQIRAHAMEVERAYAEGFDRRYGAMRDQYEIMMQLYRKKIQDTLVVNSSFSSPAQTFDVGFRAVENKDKEEDEEIKW